MSIVEELIKSANAAQIEFRQKLEQAVETYLEKNKNIECFSPMERKRLAYRNVLGRTLDGVELDCTEAGEVTMTFNVEDDVDKELIADTIWHYSDYPVYEDDQLKLYILFGDNKAELNYAFDHFEEYTDLIRESGGYKCLSMKKLDYPAGIEVVVEE